MQYVSDRIASEHNYCAVSHHTTGDKYVDIDCLRVPNGPVVVSLSTRRDTGATGYDTALFLKKAEAQELLEKLNEVLNGATVSS